MKIIWYDLLGLVWINKIPPKCQNLKVGYNESPPEQPKIPKKDGAESDKFLSDVWKILEIYTRDFKNKNERGQ